MDNLNSETFTFSYLPAQGSEMQVRQVVKEFFEAKRVQRLSENTLTDYEISLRAFVEMFGDLHMTEITPADIRTYLDSRPDLTRKSIKNRWGTLSSLWSWAIKEGYAVEHVPRKVRPPKPEQRAIHPFSKGELMALLAACKRTRLEERNKAILMVLMDTGLRSSELCNLRMSDIHSTNLYVMGKGQKERYVPLSRKTWKAILEYLKVRYDDNEGDPLFVSYQSSALTRSGLQQLMKRLSRFAGVKNVHPHRFRHTFAVQYLMNGGDPFTLKRILGHSSMDMVEHYLELSRENVTSAHTRASPVSHLGD